MSKPIMLVIDLIEATQRISSAVAEGAVSIGHVHCYLAPI